MTDARLLWLYDQVVEHQLTDDALKAAQIAALTMLLAMDARGRAQVTKAELGALIGMKERQAGEVLKGLETHIAAFIKKQRHGGAGKGRVANSYVIRPDATGGELPVDWRNDQTEQPAENSNPQSSASNPVPAENCRLPGNQRAIAGSENGNQQSSAGAVAPVVIGEILPPISTGARAQTQPSNTTLSELNPETVEFEEAAVAPRELRLNGSAIHKPTIELAEILIASANSPWLDPQKSPSLNTTHARIRAWMSAGADFDSDIHPTIVAVMSRHRTEPVTLWGYFDKPVRAAAAQRKAAEAQMSTITAAEANHDHASRTSEPRIRRDPISPTTAARNRRRAERESRREPIDLGRLDSVTIE